MPRSYVAQLPHTIFLFSFMLFLFVLSLPVSSAALQPFSLFVCSPRGIPLSFCISLSPSVSLHPVSFSSCPLLLHLSVVRTLNLFIRCRFIFCLKCVCLSLLLQWSYGFYLTHNQGQSGFEFFFKTKELKKKWLEQFGMAMWVCFVCECVSLCLSCIMSQDQSALIAHPVFQVRLLDDLWGTLWQKDEQIMSCTLTFWTKTWLKIH